MKTTMKIISIFFYVIFGAALVAAAIVVAMQLVGRLPENPYASLGLLVLVAVPYLFHLFTRRIRTQGSDEETTVHKGCNLMLYPRAKTDPQPGKAALQWNRELLECGFVEAGRYVAYEQRMEGMRRMPVAIDGFANAKENLFAAVRTQAGDEDVQIFTPYADGSSFACDNTLVDNPVLEQRTPRHRLISGRDCPIMEMVDRAAKNRPAGELSPVSPEAFRDVFTRRELECREWEDAEARRLNRIDLEAREELYRNAPRLLTNPQAIALTPENFIIVHDGLSKLDVLFLLARTGGIMTVRKHAGDDAWRDMTPRELYRHAATSGWAGKVTHLLAMETPTLADVYLTADGESD